VYNLELGQFKVIQGQVMVFVGFWTYRVEGKCLLVRYVTECCQKITYVFIFFLYCL